MSHVLASGKSVERYLRMLAPLQPFVREQSGGRIATVAAKACKEAPSLGDGQVADPVPAKPMVRFHCGGETTWRRVRVLSRSEFEDARAGKVSKLAAAESEVEKLAAAVQEPNAEHERADTTAAARNDDRETAVDQAKCVIAVADEQAVTAEGIAAGLREALTTLEPATDRSGPGRDRGGS